MLSYVFSRRTIQRVHSDSLSGQIEQSKSSASLPPPTNGVSLFGDWWIQPADESNEKVTLLQVLNMWDTILISKVEEKPRSSSRSGNSSKTQLSTKQSDTKLKDKTNEIKGGKTKLDDNAKGVDKIITMRERMKDFTLPIISQFSPIGQGVGGNAAQTIWDQRRNMVNSYLQ
eukprot:TRINITY_DN21196_c0_g3_i1.p3 TRINITY_DN21196_c0_g3~~TRINITY_DN21196_c0_g3_i1.p3  ORF type:complete len:179 (-),score=12.98 TRINITY_DN21196_c0_g3_i1:345-860(-)